MPADVSSGRERRIPLLHGSKDPFACVSEGLERVEENLARAIRSREQDLTDISAHLILSGGKRVRPMVTLLAYSAFGGQDTQDIVDIATAIELIHTATLLHDDIIDGAETRRGKESAYKKFGLSPLWSLEISCLSKLLNLQASSMKPWCNGPPTPARS